MPPKCPVENSPFSEESNRPWWGTVGGGAPPSNSFPDPWAGQQGLHPRSSSPAGRGDVSESANNSLAVRFDAYSPVDPREANATDQSAVQQLWGLLDPHNSQSINSPSSEKQNVLNNPNHTQQTTSKSAQYFNELLNVNVAAEDDQATTPVTTTPPVSTTSAVSSQHTMGTHLV